MVRGSSPAITNAIRCGSSVGRAAAYAVVAGSSPVTPDGASYKALWRRLVSAFPCHGKGRGKVRT